MSIVKLVRFKFDYTMSNHTTRIVSIAIQIDASIGTIILDFEEKEKY